jgi:hypothetical protein
MSNLNDIFNLSNEMFVTPPTQKESKDLEFYKPYSENGKDGVYKSLIRFVPNPAEPAKSKIHKYYVYLKDPVSGDSFSADCPSTVGKKSVLKDLFWKLKQSHSAADQELSKNFSRKEDYYTLIQIVADKNKPELEGKVMLWKFGKKVNDMIENQLKPEYGEACNPYDLFSGKLFAVHVRKVGDWNNYDMCQFVGEKCSIEVNGRKMEKTQDDMNAIVEYLKTGPQNLSSFDYKEWDDSMTEKVMNVIRNTVPDGRLINEITSGAGYANSKPSNPVSYSSPSAPEHSAPAPVTTSVQDDFFANANSSLPTSQPAKPAPSSAPQSSSSSLDDLYADL